MGCDCAQSVVVIPPTQIFTRVGTAPIEAKVPLSGPFPTANVRRLMIRWRLGQISGDLKARLNIRVSDNLFSWEDADVGSYVTTETWNQTTVELADLAVASPGMFYQVGVTVDRVSTGTVPNSANVELIITASSFDVA